jgi:hypothetical protein
MFRDPGFIHRVRFDSKHVFDGGVCVSFRFGQETWSGNKTFCNGSRNSTQFLAFADVGAWTDDGDPRSVVARMETDVMNAHHDFVLLPGDVAYAEGFEENCFVVLFLLVLNRVISGKDLCGISFERWWRLFLAHSFGCHCRKSRIWLHRRLCERSLAAWKMELLIWAGLIHEKFTFFF